MPFPFVKQPDAMDCGPACLTMITQENYLLCFLTQIIWINPMHAVILQPRYMISSIGVKTERKEIMEEHRYLPLTADSLPPKR